MKKFLFYFIQLTILLTIVFLIVLSNQKIDFFWKGIVFTGNTSTLLIGLVILIFIALIFQRIYLYIKQSPGSNITLIPGLPTSPDGSTKIGHSSPPKFIVAETAHDGLSLCLCKISPCLYKRV